jgi:hypothetical protein
MPQEDMGMLIGPKSTKKEQQEFIAKNKTQS